MNGDGEWAICRKRRASGPPALKLRQRSNRVVHRRSKLVRHHVLARRAHQKIADWWTELPLACPS